MVPCPGWRCPQMVLQAVGRPGPLACGLAHDILCNRCQTGRWRQCCFAWSNMDLGWKAVGWNLDVNESPASKPAGQTPLLVAISLHQHLWAWFTTQFPFYFIITVWQGYVSNNQLRSWQLLTVCGLKDEGVLVCGQSVPSNNESFQQKLCARLPFSDTVSTHQLPLAMLQALNWSHFFLRLQHAARAQYRVCYCLVESSDTG